MAILKLEDGIIIKNLPDITSQIASLNIQLNYWNLGDDARIKSLLAQDNLTEAQKEQILQALDGYFQHLQRTLGYQSRDLIVLHPEIPQLEAMLAKFAQIHTHSDDEVRYVIAGEAIFGFVRPDGSQVELTIQPEEYINIPSGTEHWFELTPTKGVKAVRYFISTEGWVPQYTGTAIRTHGQMVA